MWRSSLRTGIRIEQSTVATGSGSGSAFASIAGTVVNAPVAARAGAGARVRRWWATRMGPRMCRIPR